LWIDNNNNNFLPFYNYSTFFFFFFFFFYFVFVSLLLNHNTTKNSSEIYILNEKWEVEGEWGEESCEETKKKNENLTKFVSLTLISNCQIKDEREKKKRNQIWIFHLCN